MNAKKRSKSASGSRIIIRVLALFLSLVVALLACEVVFRVAGIKGTYLKFRSDLFIPPEKGLPRRVPHGYVPFSTKRSVYDSDPRGYFDEGGVIEHHFNSVGWRDVEHSLEKPPDTYRILGLGDSYTFGQGVRLEDLSIKRLEKLLEKKLNSLRFETINAGKSAYNTIDEKDLLETKGIDYDPDLVIVFFVPNDLEPNVHGEGPKIVFYKEYTNTYMMEDKFSKYSYLWSWVRQRYLKYTKAQDYIRECLELFRQGGSKWILCRNALKEIRQICEGRGTRLLVAVFPFFIELEGSYPFQPIHDLVKGFCTEEKIHYIDLREHYREYNGPELWVHPTDQHPNENAHRIAAEAIASYLTKNWKSFKKGDNK